MYIATAVGQDAAVRPGLLKNGGLMSEILPENNHSSFLKGLLLQTDKKQPSKQALDPPAQNNNVTS